MIIKKKHLTPDWVEILSSCEVFVFGSNLEGKHYGGAARTAYEKFGAEWGVGDGPTGRCYAIPTMHGGLDAIRPYVKKFIEYAKEHPMNRFLLTRVGCGIAGFKDIDMGQLFEDIIDVPNITWPKEWVSSLGIGVTLGLKIPRGRDAAPLVVTDKNLKALCQKHLYEIGAGIDRFLPRVKIRYVEEQGKFGYKYLGDFFFFYDDFYVWDKDERWAEYHNQELVEEIFGDECVGRGYAHRVLFAGVETEFCDYKGEQIYTGDVIKIEEKNAFDRYYAVGAFADEEGNGNYQFILDNHGFLLEDCRPNRFKMTRVGTVFFQLDPCDSININEQVMKFNGWRDTEEERKRKVFKAQYTPNFDQEEWKYDGLEILGVEFNWRK